MYISFYFPSPPSSEREHWLLRHKGLYRAVLNGIQWLRVQPGHASKCEETYFIAKVKPPI